VVEFNSRLTGGGVDDRCVRVAAELRRQGCDISIAGPDDREFSAIAKELRVPLLTLGGHGIPRVREILQLATFIRQQRPHVVQARHGRDYWTTVVATRLSGMRPRIILFRHLAKSPGSWVSRRFLLGRCDAFVAVSEFVARVLREGASEPSSPEEERRHRPPMAGRLDRIHVIHGGFDMTRFRPADASELRHEWGVPPEAFVFGVVGGYPLPRGKGQREFLKAAVEVARKLPRARFLIIGRGDMRSLLESDIQRLGLTGKAWLTPYCTNMPQAMNAIDCLVHPQVGTEALPGVVLEAFACGRRVVATDLDGVPEAFQVGGEGRLVPAEDVAALTEAMVGTAGLAPLGPAAREQLHQRVKARFSLETAARNLLELYGKLGVAGANPVATPA